MKKEYTKTRVVALLSVLVFVFTLVLSGCSIGKKFEKPKTDSDGNDIINIGEGDSNLPPDAQIVVGSDGQSYLVDGQGNSYVYNPSSPNYDIPVTPVQPAPTPDVTPEQPDPTPDVTPEQPDPTPDVTPEQPDPTPGTDEEETTESTTTVYNALAVQRKFGFNKAYDNFAGFANFYLDTIRVYFTYDNRDWLIEFWKGEYAMASVGCEIGFYYNNSPSSDTNAPLAASLGEKKHFKAVEDKDAMFCSMELWQYVKSTDAEPVKRIDFGRRRCWWAASFENGVLEKHSDRTSLVMRGMIEFPTYEMMELFVNGLEERGFKEGSTSSYKNVERYTVSGKKVTVNWRYYDEDRFQGN